jgi:Protein of unknown function (DUF3445)
VGAFAFFFPLPLPSSLSPLSFLPFPFFPHFPLYLLPHPLNIHPRFFAKLPASKPIQRGAWGIEIGAPLFIPPDDPSEAWRKMQRRDIGVADITLRVDWQTLRRLPLSGGVLFNYKAVFSPLEQLRSETCVPGIGEFLLSSWMKMVKKALLTTTLICVP